MKKTVLVCDQCQVPSGESFTNWACVGLNLEPEQRSYHLCPDCAEPLRKSLAPDSIDFSGIRDRLLRGANKQ